MSSWFLRTFGSADSMVASETKKSKEDVRRLNGDLRILERDTAILRDKTRKCMAGGRIAEATSMAERVVAAEAEVAAIHRQISDRQRITSGTKASLASHKTVESIHTAAEIRASLGSKFDHAKTGGEIIKYKTAERAMRKLQSSVREEMDDDDDEDDDGGDDKGGDPRVLEILDMLPGGDVHRIQNLPAPPSGPIRKRQVAK